MFENDPELQAAADAAARSRKSDKRWKLLLTGISILLGIMTVLALWLAMTNARLATENGHFAAQQQGEKKEIAKEAQKALCGTNDRVIYDAELCKWWAEAAQEPTVPPKDPALDVRPTQAELVNAFRVYCANGNCKGADGRPPTPDDIAAAFVRFCSDGRCKGPAGERGEDGKPLPPEYSMVLAAVQAVCANDACRGPAGQNGKDGAGGKDGMNATPEMVLAAVQQFCANDACRGQAGATGDKGDKGDKGDQGDQGEAPTSITIMDPAGRKQTCTPNPPGSTDYTCTYDSGPGVTP